MGAGADLNPGQPSQNSKTTRLLLEAGADINAVGGGDYGSPLQVAVAGVNSAEMVMLLVDAGADNTVPGGEYGLVLQTAIQMGDTANIWLLLKAGADVNA